MSAPTTHDLAFEALCVRLDVVERWADDLDMAYDSAVAEQAMNRVERAYDGQVVSDDEGITLMACYVLAVETAVRDAAEGYSSITQHPVPAGHVTNPPQSLW